MEANANPQDGHRPQAPVDTIAQEFTISAGHSESEDKAGNHPPPSESTEEDDTDNGSMETEDASNGSEVASMSSGARNRYNFARALVLNGHFGHFDDCTCECERECEHVEDCNCQCAYDDDEEATEYVIHQQVVGLLPSLAQFFDTDPDSDWDD